MNVNKPLTLLGGISPAEFMKTYWQRKPLLVRQAIPEFKALLSRSELFDLAEHNEVESRWSLAQTAASVIGKCSAARSSAEPSPS